MHPDEFMKVADEALARGRPVDFRVAIGRAYYSAFNVAKSLLTECHCAIDNNPGAHGQISRLLGFVECDEDVLDAGHWIRDGKNVRNKADYDLIDSKPEQAGVAKTFVAEAKHHVVALRAAFSGKNRDNIIAALNEYHRRMKPGYVPPT